MLGIEIFEDKNIQICSYCQRLFNMNQIPPRSKLNNMDRGEVPMEIDILTNIEKMFIAQVKVFQTVVKLGPVGRRVPYKPRLSALKGNAIHIPLPLQQTIKQLEKETDFTKIPGEYIIMQRIQNNELLLRNLVHLPRVHKALAWLKKYNPLYKDIIIPPRQLLFSDVLPEESHIPSNTCDLTYSDENDMDVQIQPAGTECPLSKDELTVVNNDNTQVADTVRNDCVKPSNDNTQDNILINEIEKTSETVDKPLEDGESNPTKMIQKLSSLEVQNDLEHFSVVPNDLHGKITMDYDNFYKFLNIDTEPLSYKEKYIDFGAFPEIFPYGKAGENSPRDSYLQPVYYEKTRLLTVCSKVRRNIPYIFYLLHRNERRLINQGVYIYEECKVFRWKKCWTIKKYVTK